VEIAQGPGLVLVLGRAAAAVATGARAGPGAENFGRRVAGQSVQPKQEWQGEERETSPKPAEITTN